MEKQEVKMVKARALKQGYRNHVRVYEGDVFMVKETEFSDRWMEKVGEASESKHAETPVKKSKPKDVQTVSDQEVI